MKYADYRGPIQGKLSLEVTEPGTGEMSLLSTSAPFAEVEITTKPRYDDAELRPFTPFPTFEQRPVLAYTDLIIRVRMASEPGNPGELYRLQRPAPESTEDVIRRVLDEVGFNAVYGANWITDRIMVALRKAGRA